REEHVHQVGALGKRQLRVTRPAPGREGDFLERVLVATEEREGIGLREFFQGEHLPVVEQLAVVVRQRLAEHEGGAFVQQGGVAGRQFRVGQQADLERRHRRGGRAQRERDGGRRLRPRR